MSKQIEINLNRRLMSHEVVNQIRDTAKAKGMLAGTAVLELIEEYDRLRYIAEAIITAHERGKTKDMEKGIGVLRMLL